jgi:hypothetical protein
MAAFAKTASPVGRLIAVAASLALAGLNLAATGAADGPIAGGARPREPSRHLLSGFWSMLDF